MRKITFNINDLEWMRQHYKISDKEFDNIFGDKTSFQVTYILVGNESPDRYELFDMDGNKLNINDRNGYERGFVFNDCYKYFMGKTSDPYGVISIKEEEIEV